MAKRKQIPKHMEQDDLDMFYVHAAIDALCNRFGYREVASALVGYCETSETLGHPGLGFKYEGENPDPAADENTEHMRLAKAIEGVIDGRSSDIASGDYEG
jgi:hypothetical protein